MTTWRAIAVGALALACAGCGGDGDEPSAPAAGGEPAVELRVVERDRAGEVARASLRCEGDRAIARGYESADARTLCRAALGLERFLAREPDARRVCTQVYGGPETAHIAGTIRGRRIDRRFSRSDGCRISDWDRVQVLIPVVVD